VAGLVFGLEDGFEGGLRGVRDYGFAFGLAGRIVSWLAVGFVEIDRCQWDSAASLLFSHRAVRDDLVRGLVIGSWAGSMAGAWSASLWQMRR
jgi:hypothetical protein